MLEFLKMVLSSPLSAAAFVAFNVFFYYRADWVGNGIARFTGREYSAVVLLFTWLFGNVAIALALA